MEKVQELQRLVVELYDSFENDNRKGVEEIRQVLANVMKSIKRVVIHWLGQEDWYFIYK